jgi:hypothetical protein
MIAPTIPMILITLNKLCWNPLPAPLHIENKITEFEKMLREQQSILALKQNKTNLCNLTYMQLLTLKSLKQNINLTIKPTGKHLVPAIMDTQAYIKQVLMEHLLTEDYMLLSTES